MHSENFESIPVTEPKMDHVALQIRNHTRPSTWMASRGLYKAVVRKIPAFLTKTEFF